MRKLFLDPDIVPEEYADAMPENVPQIQSVTFGDGRYGACFIGDTGIGKTYAATALARKLVSESPLRWNCKSRLWECVPGVLRWTSAPYLLARIRGTFRRQNGPSEAEIIEDFIKATIFVLDDLGAEKQTDFSSSTLYTILSERRNRRRFTIITSNQGLDQIISWEPRIASRMSEMLQIPLPDHDWRLEQAASAKLIL